MLADALGAPCGRRALRLVAWRRRRLGVLRHGGMNRTDLPQWLQQ